MVKRAKYLYMTGQKRHRALAIDCSRFEEPFFNDFGVEHHGCTKE